MIWIIISIVLGIILFIWYMRRPYYHRGVKQNELERFIRGLMDQCDDGSLLFIEHENSDRFIQFAKYETKKIGTILHFGFPDAPWSREYFKRMVIELQDAGMDYSIQSTGEESVRRFIDVDIEATKINSIEKRGAKLAQIAFRAMGLGQNEKYRVRYDADLSPRAFHNAMEQIKMGRKLKKGKDSGA